MFCIDRVHIKIYVDLSLRVIFKALEKSIEHLQSEPTVGYMMIYDISIHVTCYMYSIVTSMDDHGRPARGHQQYQCHPSGRPLWTLNVEH